VTLEPGAGQTVRIMVRKPANLDAGEYRSHLLFTKQPEANPRNGQPQINTDSDKIGISVSLLIGASIPVIVRHGNTDAEVSLSNLAIDQPSANQTILSVQINRQGNQSVYGDLAVSFTPEGGKEQVIARANGLAVYAPNSHRRINLNLTTPEGGSLSGGRINVVYRQQAEQGGAVLAETAARVR
ncbi:MAG: molecular chaperone, partial [Pseudohongiellaceae bacterium]